MNYSANDILIIIIGIFISVTGIMYLWQIRKNSSKTNREKIVSVVLILLGVAVVSYPVLTNSLNGKGDSMDGKDLDTGSSLIGSQAYTKKAPPDPANYDAAGKWYEKGVGLWNGGINGYDSTDYAMECFDKSIELYPTAEAYTARGQLKMQLSEMQQALEDYHQAIELKPEYGNAYFNRATVYFIMGNNEMACQDLAKSVELKVPGAEDARMTVCN